MPPANGSSFVERVAAAWPVADWRHVNVAAAVSGGADSVAMLRALAELKKTHPSGRGELTVVHVDHGVRGLESAADADWVVQLCESLGLRCLVRRRDCPPEASEAALRSARREFYRQAAAESGARFLATGHNADDQSETVLFRALRGSGMRGLAGIRPFAPLTESCTLVRPLLTLNRSDVQTYLEQIGQRWRHDTSNDQIDYTRNWLRQQILPALEGRIPGCSSNLGELARHAAELDATVAELASELLEEAQRAGDPWRFDRAVLEARPTSLVAEMLRLAWRRAGWPEQAMTAPNWRRLADFATRSTTAPPMMLPGAVRAELRDGLLVLSRTAT